MLAGVFASAVSCAQGAPFLSAQEVTELATNKKWQHVRTADKHQVLWDLRSGGNLYANNFSTNNSDTATWQVYEAGQLCVKWRGRSQNHYVHVRRKNNKLQMVDSNDLA